MTFAWYGHLKFRSEALWKVIVASWGIAFFEYCFQVPANRIGLYEFTPAQLKTIQEIITLSIFPVFSIFCLGDHFKSNYGVGFSLLWRQRFLFFQKGRLKRSSSPREDKRVGWRWNRSTFHLGACGLLSSP